MIAGSTFLNFTDGPKMAPNWQNIIAQDEFILDVPKCDPVPKIYDKIDSWIGCFSYICEMMICLVIHSQTFL